VAAVISGNSSVITRTQATAAEVLARGARAVARLTAFICAGQLRTYPEDNFSYIQSRLRVFIPLNCGNSSSRNSNGASRNRSGS